MKKAKALGNIIDATNNIDNAITDRIRKSNLAWKLLKGNWFGKQGSIPNYD